MRPQMKNSLRQDGLIHNLTSDIRRALAIIQLISRKKLTLNRETERDMYNTLQSACENWKKICNERRVSQTQDNFFKSRHCRE